jgi:hypothetical protein
MSNKDEIAALKKKVEELEAKVSPPKSDFVPMSDAEWRDKMHQAAERRMSMATPPSVIRDWNVLDENLLKGVRDVRVRQPVRAAQSQTRNKLGAVARRHRQRQDGPSLGHSQILPELIGWMRN